MRIYEHEAHEARSAGPHLTRDRSTLTIVLVELAICNIPLALAQRGAPVPESARPIQTEVVMVRMRSRQQQQPPPQAVAAVPATATLPAAGPSIAEYDELKAGKEATDAKLQAMQKQRATWLQEIKRLTQLVGQQQMEIASLRQAVSHTALEACPPLVTLAEIDAVTQLPSMDALKKHLDWLDAMHPSAYRAVAILCVQNLRCIACHPDGGAEASEATVRAYASQLSSTAQAEFRSSSGRTAVLLSSLYRSGGDQFAYVFSVDGVTDDFEVQVYDTLMRMCEVADASFEDVPTFVRLGAVVRPGGGLDEALELETTVCQRMRGDSDDEIAISRLPRRRNYEVVVSVREGWAGRHTLQSWDLAALQDKLGMGLEVLEATCSLDAAEHDLSATEAEGVSKLMVGRAGRACTLTSLDLSFNQLRVEGAKRIAQGLRQSSSV